MLETQERLAAIENTKHDRFAVNHRNDRNAKVDFAPGDAKTNASVLRDALFSDVQVRKNLDAADNRRVILAKLGRHRRLDQHAVDAITDAELILERLDVHVAGSHVECL